MVFRTAKVYQYPHHIGDFRGGTVNRTRLERWIYRDLLDVYYDKERPLPLDLAEVCREVGVRADEERAIVADLLGYKFTKTEDGYVHGVCDRVIAAWQARGWRPRDPSNPPKRPSIDEWKVIRERIFARDDYTCRYCGARGGYLECDHVHPVSRGGSSADSNLSTACKACNRDKGSKTLEEWRGQQ